MKHILLIITRASPQVLTETLFAIHKQGKSLPNELYVITTQSTKPLLVDGLFNQDHFQQLLTDYKLPEIEFSEKNIWLIEDQNGQPVFDASTEDMPCDNFHNWRMTGEKIKQEFKRYN